MIASIRLAIAFLPAPIQAVILGALALLSLIVVFRLIKMVLDSIPFL